MQQLYYLKWPLIIFLGGAIVRIVGALMKILHWRGADQMLVISTAIMATGLVFLISKLVLLKKNGRLPEDRS